MIRILSTASKDFDDRLGNLQSSRVRALGGSDSQVNRTVSAIIEDIANHGDKALSKYLKKYDNRDLSELAVSATQVERAKIDPEIEKSLRHSIARVQFFHHQQRQRSVSRELVSGAVKIDERFVALDSVAVYAPSGSATYPTSVIMGVVPAQEAGVERITLATPNPDDILLVTARILGIKEIYAMGGAHAIAALALGTEAINPVDAIAGPGNAYVAAAKRKLRATVGIDSEAGPSEILIIADDNANLDWLAADLLAQAEHDKLSQVIAVVTSSETADRLAARLQDRLATLPGNSIADRAVADYGALIICRHLEEAADIANRLAPEHLHIMTDSPRELLPLIRHAGAIFLGEHTPVALGDYIAGANHILPTNGTTRFASGLGIDFFLRRQSILEADPKQASELSRDAELLAMAEGFSGHAESLKLRTTR